MRPVESNESVERMSAGGGSPQIRALWVRRHRTFALNFLMEKHTTLEEFKRGAKSRFGGWQYVDGIGTGMILGLALSLWRNPEVYVWPWLLACGLQVASMILTWERI